MASEWEIDGLLPEFVEEIKRIGKLEESGLDVVVTFGDLYKDDKCAEKYAFMLGDLLRRAKVKKMVSYAGSWLKVGAHDTVTITLDLRRHGK